MSVQADNKATSSALRSLTQPCMTASDCQILTYDPGIPPGSANQRILGDVYLRSNPPREWQRQACIQTCNQNTRRYNGAKDIDCDQAICTKYIYRNVNGQEEQGAQALEEQSCLLP